MGRPPSLVDRLRPVFLNVAFWGCLVASPFLAMALVIESGLPGWLGVLIALLVPLVIASLPGLRRYPITAVGPRERVDRTTFREGVERCGACQEITEQGLRTRYARQWVLFGIPLHTIEWGENAYCPDCVDPATLTVDSHDHDGRKRARDRDAASDPARPRGEPDPELNRE